MNVKITCAIKILTKLCSIVLSHLNCLVELASELLLPLFHLPHPLVLGCGSVVLFTLSLNLACICSALVGVVFVYKLWIFK